MNSICGFWPKRGCAFRARPDGRLRTLKLAPSIHRSIWLGLLYCPGPTEGCRCILEPPSLYLYGEVVLVGVWRRLPLYLACVVAGLVHRHGHVLMVWARGLHRQIVVVPDASDNSLLGVEGRTLRQLGPGSNCH